MTRASPRHGLHSTQERDTRLRQLGGGGGGGAANGAAGGGGGGGGGYPRCHFFNSFFYNKLFQVRGLAVKRC